MPSTSKSATLLSSLLLAGSLVLSAQVAQAAGSENSHAQEHANEHSKVAVQHDGFPFSANLFTAQHVYYEGDALNIKVKFSRGGDLLAQGEADAYFVIYMSDGTMTSVPIADSIGDSVRQYFKVENIDTSALTEGQYQLGLLLTIPGGDPANLSDWYSGFRAILDTEAIYISSTPLPGDADADGQWDDDTNGDGLSGDEGSDDDLSVDSSDDSSSDSGDSSTDTSAA